MNDTGNNLNNTTGKQTLGHYVVEVENDHPNNLLAALGQEHDSQKTNDDNHIIHIQAIPLNNNNNNYHFNESIDNNHSNPHSSNNSGNSSLIVNNLSRSGSQEALTLNIMESNNHNNTNNVTVPQLRLDYQSWDDFKKSIKNKIKAARAAIIINQLIGLAVLIYSAYALKYSVLMMFPFYGSLIGSIIFIISNPFIWKVSIHLNLKSIILCVVLTLVSFLYFLTIGILSGTQSSSSLSSRSSWQSYSADFRDSFNNDENYFISEAFHAFMTLAAITLAHSFFNIILSMLLIRIMNPVKKHVREMKIITKQKLDTENRMEKRKADIAKYYEAKKALNEEGGEDEEDEDNLDRLPDGVVSQRNSNILNSKKSKNKKKSSKKEKEKESKKSKSKNSEDQKAFSRNNNNTSTSNKPKGAGDSIESNNDLVLKLDPPKRDKKVKPKSKASNVNRNEPQEIEFNDPNVVQD